MVGVPNWRPASAQPSSAGNSSRCRYQREVNASTEVAPTTSAKAATAVESIMRASSRAWVRWALFLGCAHRQFR
jgi:hypothetical protein